MSVTRIVSLKLGKCRALTLDTISVIQIHQRDLLLRLKQCLHPIVAGKKRHTKRTWRAPGLSLVFVQGNRLIVEGSDIKSPQQA
jgi:hypothetical protein